MSKELFPLGQVVATPGAAALMTDDVAADFLYRHITGDWGELDQEDKASNDRAVQDGLRILSEYSYNGNKFWVITEWDRSVTTILLPDEY